ncbi:hypothetical protein [Lampropedia cohaerens]|nr:hypothetical protein [Lampropedia cohaerens]
MSDTSLPPVARFVPTLTEIVELPPPAETDAHEDLPAAQARSAQQPLAAPAVPDADCGGAAMQPHAPVRSAAEPDADALPPPFLPPSPLAAEASHAAGAAPLSVADLRAMLPPDFEEQLLHRLMHRVDAVLAERVGTVIAAVVERQTRALLPGLREELEGVVRRSVDEAMAEELAAAQAELRGR